MTPFRVGVVGCGRIASVYHKALKALEEEGRIVVCCAMDKELARAQSFAAAFAHCRATDSFPELLAQELDAVHILTPHFWHAEQSIACLEAGFHVLCEKPIAIHLADADAMIAAQERTGRQLAIIYQNRYLPGIVRAKELLQSGALGRVTGAWSILHWCRPESYYACDWKGAWETEGGGVVIDQAIHSIDLVRYLMDCEAVEVAGHIAQRVRKTIEVEDEASAAITFANGAVYSFYACNYFAENDPIQIKISCERGYIHLIEDRVELQVGSDTPIVIAPQDTQGDGGERYWGACHAEQIAAFYRDLSTGARSLVTPQDAKETLRLVQAIYASSACGSAIHPAQAPQRAMQYL